VALGTSDPDVYTFKPFFADFVITGDSDCGTPDVSDPISIPHSCSFIDLDGDCKPDLLMTRVDSSGQPYLETYVQKSIDG
jgi:hypothetical protein